jgi:hypothetical protein
MFQVYVFSSTYDGKPIASIREVEPIDWQGKRMYRDLGTGRVAPMYSEDGEQVFDTREQAVTAATERLHKLASDFAALCHDQIVRLQA